VTNNLFHYVWYHRESAGTKKEWRGKKKNNYAFAQKDNYYFWGI
jgi:hypothetical protein